MKRLVKEHIISRFTPTFNPFQFVYQPNRSTEDDISSTLPPGLAHQEDNNTRADAVPGLQFSILYHHSTASGRLTLNLGYSTPQCNWLPDWKTTVSAGQTERLQCHDPQYRLPSGLCPQPSTVYPDDTRLCPQCCDK